MSRRHGGKRRPESGFRRGLRLEEPARDLEEELRFHFEQSVADLVDEGWVEAEAKREVRRRFGDEAAYRRELGRIDRGMRRRRSWTRRIDATENTMRHVIRGIMRSPGLATGVVVAFALGIGANATMFGIVDRLLLSPPAHVVDPDGVKRLVVDRYVSFLNHRVQSPSITSGDYSDLLDLPQFTEVAAYFPQAVVVDRGESAVRVQAVLVTANWWQLLGVRPAVGRFFVESEDRIGGEPVAVIGHALWQRRFGGDASVLGETIDFGHGRFTIIGVAPKGFTGVDLNRVDLWLPLRSAGALTRGEAWLGESRGRYWLRAVGRLAPGTSVAVAAEAATAAHRTGRARMLGDNYDPEVRVVPIPLIAARAALQADREAGDGASRGGGPAAQEAKVALWLAAVSTLVLLIACVNVTNLLLARAIRRRRETAIRVALGVSSARLIGQTVAEGLVMAALGGVCALLITRWGGDLVRAVLLPRVEFADGGLTARVLPFVVVVSVLAGVIAAIIPAFEAARRNPGDTIRAGSGGITRSTQRVRGSLSMIQAALSVVLLVGAGLFLRSLHNLGALDLGFDPDGLYVVTPEIDGGEFSEAEKRVFFSATAERLATLPGVSGVAWSQSVPYYTSWATRVQLPGRDSLPVPGSGGPYINAVSPAYFRTLDLRILRGRDFETADFGSGLYAVVNDALAKLWWPGSDPLGECMQIGEEPDDPPCSTVVGVVEDARRGSLMEEANPQYYVPDTHPALESSGEAFFIRMRDNDTRTIAAVRRTLHGQSARVRFANIRPIADLSASEARAWKLGATMFTLFGLLALIIAAYGLHSLLTFDVAQRAREIGLRNALGAGTRRIVSIVVGRALRITVTGIAIGFVTALLAAPRVEQLLFQTSAHDPLTLAAVAAVLLLTAVLAAGIPAWRAARVDPNSVLRAD